jgi:CRP-like cAMP-binding protein
MIPLRGKSLLLCASRHNGLWRGSHSPPRLSGLFSLLLLANGVHSVADDTASAHLHHVLEHESEIVNKPKSTVLFRRGEKASGMFFVLSGKVRLDLGVDSAVSRTCGQGALVGLPSTLTRQNYSMTATVTEDAELGFRSPDALGSLLRTHPDFCQPLLAILGAKIAENHEVERALLARDKQPVV